MKKLNKLFSVLLVLALTLCLAVPAMAAVGDPPSDVEGTDNTAAKGKITIVEPYAERTYTLYRLFDLKSFDKDNNRYAYEISPKWAGFFADASAAGGKSLVTVDAKTGAVSLNTATQPGAAELAKRAEAWLTGHVIANDGEATAAAAGENPEIASENLVFSNLDLGYYMVKSSQGILCALDTTQNELNVYEKNVLPEIHKVASDTTVTIGKKVSFAVPVVKGDTRATSYIIEDTLTDLKLDGTSVKVNLYKKEGNSSFNPKTLTYAAVAGLQKAAPGFAESDYAITPADGSLKVEIKSAGLAKMGKEDFLIITYDAEALAETMNNEVKLSYGSHVTPSVKIDLKNFKFQLHKFSTTTAGETPLAGAKFKLYDEPSSESGRSPYKLMVSGSDYTVATTAQVTANGASLTDEITAGTVNIKGLDAGTYYLQEIEAPAGYNKLQADVKVVITDEGTVTIQFDGDRTAADASLVDGIPQVKVENKTGVEMPSTGGIGTTIFYVVGGLLMVAALVLFITKRKMNQK